VDSGVQTVLYFNAEGVNRFIGIPAGIAAHLWALDAIFSEFAQMALNLEARAAYCLSGVLPRLLGDRPSENYFVAQITEAEVAISSGRPQQ
jgi:hypothetical protein